MKTIFAHMNGTAIDETVLAGAFRLARRLGAHVEGVRVHPDPAAMAIDASIADMGTATMIAEVLKGLEKRDKDRTNAARATFQAFCQREAIPVTRDPTHSGVSGSWYECEGDAVEQTIACGRLHDLVVLESDGKDTSEFIAEDIGTILVALGRPVLLLPERPVAELGRAIAVAWKDAPEAARALTASAPILAKADRVVILGVGEDEAAHEADKARVEAVAANLRWSGVTAEARYLTLGSQIVPDALFAAARAEGADMMVMGGYGHSRLREWVFGGVTRRVLEDTPMPVLLFH
jgi:nucleotide-binding universal stress UspA family protein